MNACITTKTNYIDLASDPFRYSGIAEGTTLGEQLELYDMFYNSNLVAVTNTGFSPGFTDILCKNIIDKYELESVSSIKIYYGEMIKSKCDKLVVSWSPYILLLETISPPTVFRKNKIIELDINSSEQEIEFPKPIGKLKVRPFNGHPELETIPEFIDIPIDYIEIGGGINLNGSQLNDMIVEALSSRVKENLMFDGDILENLSKSFENPDDFYKNYKQNNIVDEELCCLFEIVGERNGRQIKYNAIIQHNLKDIIKKVPGSVATFVVSLVPAVIADKIISDKIKERGVIVPAQITICSEIIDECKEMGLEIQEMLDNS